MSLDRSLKSANALIRHRNVLTRAERLDVLAEEERWDDSKSVFGLPKVAHRKQELAKAEKVEGAEGAVPGATPAAGGAAPAAGAAAKAGAAPAAKGGAVSAGKGGAAPAKAAAPAAKAAAPAAKKK